MPEPLPVPIPLAEIEAARERLAGNVLRTPLVPLQADDAPARIHLKLENLQPVGSFKLRGAANVMAQAGPEALAGGVYTASAGNMAQGVAWVAREMGIDCSVVVPDHAPDAKIDAIEKLGGRVVKVPFEEWWEVIVNHEFPGLDGYFVHPVSNRHVMAGNGTIGLEILDDLPDVDAVVVPYGGGGLSSGIASAIGAHRADVPVYAAEVVTSAALSAALAAGAPTDIDYRPSFVDGIGSGRVLDEMWPLVSTLLAGSLTVELDEVAEAIRLLMTRNQVVAEGAGAASVAAALGGGAGTGNVVCVISGGRIDPSKLATILAGGMP